MSEALKLPENQPNEKSAPSKQTPKSKPIKLPVLRGFKTHITRMCLLQITGYLNEQLMSGEMSEKLGTAITTEHIRAADVKIESIRCWRINQTDLETEIFMKVPMETSAGQVTQYPFYCRIWHTSDEWMSYEVEELKPYEGTLPQPVGQELDIYGLPVFYKEDIPRAAEQIWNRWRPDAMKDASLRQPEVLAAAMKLSVQLMALYNRPEQDFILFFEDGEVEVLKESDSGGKPEGQMEPVKARTIVVNTAVEWLDSAMAIYKACFSYHWQYIFYRLQDSISTDPKQFRYKKESIPEGKDRKNPLDYLWLPQGALNLMLPETILEEKIRTDYFKARAKSQCPGYSKHNGFIYQNLAISMAIDFALKPFRVKQRMNQTGHIAARGILHWEPEIEDYVVPYAVSENYKPADKDEIYFISRGNLARLYRDSKELRQALMSGDYVHVNGLVCVNDPEFIAMSYSGAIKAPKMTAWANAHADQCCLSFKRTYEEDGADPEFSYVENWNNERIMEGVLLRGNMSWDQREEKKQSLMEKMPDSFRQALAYLMANNPIRPIQARDLAREAGIKPEIITGYLSEKNDLPSFREMVQLCVALSLPPWLSEPFMKTAGYEFPRQGENAICGQMLECYYMLPVFEAMKFADHYSFLYAPKEPGQGLRRKPGKRGKVTRMEPPIFIQENES